MISKLQDISGIEECSERKQCRSDNNPEIIIAGHVVNNHMTVIKLIDGALPKEYFIL